MKGLENVIIPIFTWFSFHLKNNVLTSICKCGFIIIIIFHNIIFKYGFIHQYFTSFILHYSIFNFKSIKKHKKHKKKQEKKNLEKFKIKKHLFLKSKIAKKTFLLTYKM
jgi:hypothetical protein